MREILINTTEWTEKKQRLHEIMKKLHDAGWEKFGHSGTIVLFRDTNEENARNELRDLKIDEVSPSQWDEVS